MDKKFKKFEPMSNTAKEKIDELLKRGGILIQDKRDHVLIQRFESIAKIDQFGRVEWSANI